VSWWRPSKPGPPRVKGFNWPSPGTLMKSATERLWMLGLRRWMTTYMPPKLDGIPPLSQPHFGQSGRMQLPLPKVETLSPPGLPKIQKTIRGGQISFPCRILYINGKLLKCRCPKWVRIAHLDICSPSYGQKKGQESNCQFDSRPLKVRNRPLPDVTSRSTTWR